MVNPDRVYDFKSEKEIGKKSKSSRNDGKELRTRASYGMFF